MLGSHHADAGKVGERATDLRRQRVPWRQAAALDPAQDVGSELLPDGRPRGPLHRAEQPELRPLWPVLPGVGHDRVFHKFISTRQAVHSAVSSIDIKMYIHQDEGYPEGEPR
jgi:hypothetical protein